jgi:hypothetical protein
MHEPDQPPAVDPVAILEAVRARVLNRRSTFGDDGTEREAFDIRLAIDAVQDAAALSHIVSITWNSRLGHLAALGRRPIALVLRWYFKPIVDQQTRFNTAAARAVAELNAHQERLLRVCERLDERLAALQRHLEDTRTP